MPLNAELLPPLPLQGACRNLGDGTGTDASNCSANSGYCRVLQPLDCWSIDHCADLLLGCRWRSPSLECRSRTAPKCPDG